MVCRCWSTGYKSGDIPKEAITYTEEPGRQAFEDGKLLFLRNWPYVYSLADERRRPRRSRTSSAWRRCPVLNGPGASSLGGHSERDQRLLEAQGDSARLPEVHRDSRGAQRKFFMEQGSLAPVVKALYSDPALVAKYPYLPTLVTSIENAVPRPVTPFYPAVTKAIQDNAYAAMKGDKSVDRAARRTCKRPSPQPRRLIRPTPGGRATECGPPTGNPGRSRTRSRYRFSTSNWRPRMSALLTGQRLEGPERAARSRRRRKRRARSEPGDAPAACWLIVPTLALLAVVIVYPVVYAAVSMSFQKDRGLDPSTGFFVAGRRGRAPTTPTGCSAVNCGSSAARHARPTNSGPAVLRRTVVFTVATVVLEVVLGISWFAMIMNRAFGAAALVRAAILVPWAIPTAVTAKLWYFMFAFDGIVNRRRCRHQHLCGPVTRGRRGTASSSPTSGRRRRSWRCCILAGLQIIPAERVRGGRRSTVQPLAAFTRITLPLVKPALMVAVLFRMLDVLRIYDLPWILTHGAATARTHAVDPRRRPNCDRAQQRHAALSTITFIFIFVIAFIFGAASSVSTSSRPRQGAASGMDRRNRRSIRPAGPATARDRPGSTAPASSTAARSGIRTWTSR